MSYKHISINERNKIEVLNREGYSVRKIAKILGFHHSAIRRELARCNDIYEASYSEKDYRKSLKLRAEKLKYLILLKKLLKVIYIKHGLLSKSSTES